MTYFFPLETKQKIGEALQVENYDLAEEMLRKLRIHGENSEQIVLRELKEKLSPEYVSQFSKDGVAQIKRDNKWFLIKKLKSAEQPKTGNLWFFMKDQMVEVIEGKFDTMSPFFEGVTCVSQGYEWFFINENGQEITKERFDGGGIHEGKAKVLKGGKWFFFDLKKGKIGERTPLKENTLN